MECESIRKMKLDFCFGDSYQGCETNYDHSVCFKDTPLICKVEERIRQEIKEEQNGPSVMKLYIHFAWYLSICPPLPDVEIPPA